MSMLRSPLGAPVRPLARKVTEAGGGGRIPVAIPAGLGWNSASYPLAIYQSGSRYTLDASTTWLRSFVSADIWAATPYYVDATKADNTGDGLSPATAKRDIHAAITAANADAQPAMCIYVASAAYDRNKSINSSSQTVQPSKPCALIATGGRVRHWAGDMGAAFVNDGSGTGTFTGGTSSQIAVYDRLNLTPEGLYTELALVADQATCQATPGSWADIGTTIAVHRMDGLQPTVDNTIILRNLVVADFTTFAGDFYVEGFDFEGGAQGALSFRTVVAARNVILNGCSFRYGGTSTVMTNGLVSTGVNGLTIAYDCDASGNWSDGFNYHAANGTTPSVLQIGCRAIANGKAGASSCNGFTTHENIVAIDVNGVYGPTNNGAVFHCINDTKTWALGTRVTSDAGGDTNRPCFKASNNAVMWLQGTTATAASASDYALHAQGTAGQIHKRNHTTAIGVEQVDSGAAIDTF